MDTNSPGPSWSLSGNQRSQEPIQGACLSAKAFASMSFARARIVKNDILRRSAKSQYKAASGGGALEFDPIGLARVENVEMRDVGTAGRLFS